MKLPSAATLRSLDLKFEEWQGAIMQRKVERPDNPEADTWLLLGMLVDAVLRSDNPEHINDVISFLVDECYTEPLMARN